MDLAEANTPVDQQLVHLPQDRSLSYIPQRQTNHNLHNLIPLAPIPTRAPHRLLVLIPLLRHQKLPMHLRTARKRRLGPICDQQTIFKRPYKPNQLRPRHNLVKRIAVGEELALPARHIPPLEQTNHGHDELAVPVRLSRRDLPHDDLLVPRAVDIVSVAVDVVLEETQLRSSNLLFGSAGDGLAVHGELNALLAVGGEGRESRGAEDLDAVGFDAVVEGAFAHRHAADETVAEFEVLKAEEGEEAFLVEVVGAGEEDGAFVRGVEGGLADCAVAYRCWVGA